MAVTIVPVSQEHLAQVQALVNTHLSAVVPGWGLPIAFIASRLRSDPDEFVTNPWVVERQTLCAVERGRVVAVAHLARYGAGPEVSDSFRGVGDVQWLLAWPETVEAASALLSAAQDQMAAWGTARVSVGMWLSGVLITGVPDVWPHIAEVFTQAGYQPNPDDTEALYGGCLDSLPPPGEPPIPGLTVQRLVGQFGVSFTAFLDHQKIGWCDCIPDLTRGGELPAMHGWAELGELQVEEQWRNRGIGAWLVQQAVAWLRLAGCDRIVLSVAARNEAEGAGRFYQRFGWDVLVRQQRGWR